MTHGRCVDLGELSEPKFTGSDMEAEIARLNGDIVTLERVQLAASERISTLESLLLAAEPCLFRQWNKEEVYALVREARAIRERRAAEESATQGPSFQEAIAGGGC